jgi:hypothetical protein
MAVWYCNYGNGSSTGYYAVAQYANLHLYSVGDIVRQLATPAVGSERCFRCTTLGTSGASEPTWTLTKGSTTNAGTAVFTEVTGNSTYNWSAPLARLSQGFSWAAAGDTIYIASASAETQASAITFTSAGTFTNLVNVICVNAAGSVPPVAADVTTGASVTTTGASGITLTSGGGSARYWGITFNVGTGSGGGTFSFNPSGNNQTIYQELDSCAVNIVQTVNAAGQIAGNTSGFASPVMVVFRNTPVSFGHVGQGFNWVSSEFSWYDTASAVGSSIHPTTLFSMDVAYQNVYCEGVDLSSVTGTLFSNGNNMNRATLQNCKINASATIKTRPTWYGDVCYVNVSDSTGTDYNQSVISIAGTLTAETTFTRVGGATTPSGQLMSWKVVTTANVSYVEPFVCFPIPIWNTVTGSTVTATIEIESAATLTISDVSAEVKYMGASSSPVTSAISSGLANPLSTASNLPTSSATWNGSLGSAVKQYLQVQFTPQLAGLYFAYVKVSKASLTVYIDPKITQT